MNRFLLALGLLVLRVGVGGMMVLLHGYPHFVMLLNGKPFADPIGLGPTTSLVLVTIAELGCATLVVLGLLTRLACIPLLFSLFIAAFVHKSGADIGHDDKQLAILYAIPFLSIMLTGPGKWSVDRRGQ